MAGHSQDTAQASRGLGGGRIMNWTSPGDVLGTLGATCISLAVLEGLQVVSPDF